MINTEGWSARKKLKHSMLRRAFNQNRGGEVILLIQWRMALVHHQSQKDVETLKNFERRNAGQPRAIRALNLIEESNGSKTVHKLSTDGAGDAKTLSMNDILKATPEEKRIVFADKARAAKIEAYKNAPALHADRYDPMEGLRVVTGYDLACRAYERVGQPRQAAPAPVLKH